MRPSISGRIDIEEEVVRVEISLPLLIDRPAGRRMGTPGALGG
jgi:hypothetical protein